MRPLARCWTIVLLIKLLFYFACAFYIPRSWLYQHEVCCIVCFSSLSYLSVHLSDKQLWFRAEQRRLRDSRCCFQGFTDESGSLLTYSALSHVSLNCIISAWVQPNVTYSRTAERHLLRGSKNYCKTEGTFLKPSSDSRFYKQEQKFYSETIQPKALITSWNCVFYYRM